MMTKKDVMEPQHSSGILWYTDTKLCRQHLHKRTQKKDDKKDIMEYPHSSKEAKRKWMDSHGKKIKQKFQESH